MCIRDRNGELHLQNHPESVKQIVAADIVIITKTDLDVYKRQVWCDRYV